MIQEEINDLEKEIKLTPDPKKKGELFEDLSDKKQCMRDLAAKEVWVIVIYTSILAIIFSLIPLLAHDLVRDCF
ncbi:MAG: hypothetical protein CVV33_09085, partial [Methanomicrobiales archaeon HGW-Methanomicrobiales-4]